MSHWMACPTGWHSKNHCLKEQRIKWLEKNHLSRDMTKPTKWLCASEDSDQPGHPPSLIRVFAVRMKKAWVLSYPFSAQRRLWSDWADSQADLSLRWAHNHIVGFVMSWLICLRTMWKVDFFILAVVCRMKIYGAWYSISGTDKEGIWWLFKDNFCQFSIKQSCGYSLESPRITKYPLICSTELQWIYMHTIANAEWQHSLFTITTKAFKFFP